MRETWVRALGWEDPLEKEMAIHSSTTAWKIPWTEEPDRLQSMGSQRVGHDWETSLSLSKMGIVNYRSIDLKVSAFRKFTICFFLFVCFFKIYLFYFLATQVFIAAHGLFSSGDEWGLRSIVVRGLLTVVLVLLWSTGSRAHALSSWDSQAQSTGSVLVAHGLNCSTACGIFLDYGSNPCFLRWQADS